MMFSSIRCLSRLRPHSSSYIITRSISANISITRPIIHTWSRYHSTTTESIIVPTTNDTTSSTSTSATTSDPVATESTEPITTTTSTTATAPITETQTQSSTSDEAPAQTSSTSTSTRAKQSAYPRVERSKTVYIPYKYTVDWIEEKLKSFGKTMTFGSFSSGPTIRVWVKYEKEGDAFRAATFFYGRRTLHHGMLSIFLAHDNQHELKQGEILPMHTSYDQRVVELTFHHIDPLKQHLEKFGNVGVYGLINKHGAMAKFETEDAAKAACEDARTHRYPIQLGVVDVNAAILKNWGKDSKSRSSTSQTTRTKRTKNKSQKDQSQADVPSAPPTSLWNETIDPASGRPYYWHSKTREVTWDRPAELGPTP